MNENIEGTQLVEPAAITLDDFRAAMADVLTPGEDVLIHASLGGLGRVEGTVEDIIAAIRAPMGSGATLVMMTDTRSFAKTGRFSMSQASETGLLTECFRLSPGVVRSCVPMVSFCAIGPRAAEYTQVYHSHLDDSATITRLLANDGRILLIGVGYEKCTLYHLSEERIGVPYNKYKEFDGFLVEDDRLIRPISQRYFVRADLTIRKDPSIAGRMLEQEGGARIRKLGQGIVRSFAARDFDSCCMEALCRDADAFLTRLA